MPWAALIPLIAQVGLPLAQQIWAMAQSGANATQSDWDKLTAIEQQTPQSHFAAIVARLGLNPNDPAVLAFAALLK